MNDWLTILLFTDAFLLLFVGADIIYRRNILSAEHTRNLVHAGSGLIALFFPFFFEEVLPVAVLCTSFLLLLVATKKLNLFGAVNAVERKTYGSILYPIIVFITFYVYSQSVSFSWPLGWPYDRLVLYFLPISIMAFADPTAALVGKHFNSAHSGRKSIHGSVAFGLAAFILSFSILNGWNNFQSGTGLIGLSAVIAIATTAAEYWSKKGWDNFTVPIITMIILRFAYELWL